MAQYEKVSLERLRDIAATQHGTIRAAALELIEIREALIESERRPKRSPAVDVTDNLDWIFEDRTW